MLDQLSHLADVAQWMNVTVQVIPFARTSAFKGGFTIAETPNGPPSCSWTTLPGIGQGRRPRTRWLR